MDEEQFFNFVTEKRSYKWDSLLEKRVEKEEIDPWGLDLRVLTGICLRKLEEEGMSLDVSGKVVLVSSILLRMKAQLLGLELFEEEERKPEPEKDTEVVGEKEIKPKLPLPKKRKATLDDLVDSLKRAIKVEKRRERRRKEVEVSDEETKKEIEKSKPNDDAIDLKKKVKEVFEKIKDTLKRIGEKTISFSRLVTGEKEEKVWTFTSLVYLANNGKVHLEQEKPFGRLEISYEP